MKNSKEFIWKIFVALFRYCTEISSHEMPETLVTKVPVKP
jgi:hypothetical protein